jgi:hypothetical protein
VAEAFTCTVDEDYRSACEGLDFYGEHEGERYCVLHFPGEEKKEDFKKVLARKFAQKDHDFGGTVFPEGTAEFRGFEFEENAFFDGAIFLGAADFSYAQFSGKEASFSGGPVQR